MARQSRRSWLRMMARIHARPIGAEPPVPWWKREVERLQRERAYKKLAPPLVTAEPPASPGKFRGYLLAAVYEGADGKCGFRWLDLRASQAFMHEWAKAEGLRPPNEKADCDGRGRNRLN